MRQYSIDPHNPDHRIIAVLADMVRQGGVLVYPTETIYGLGGDAFQLRVIEKIYTLKGRDRRKALSVIIPSAAWAERLATDITPAARCLMERFWPGPLTIVFRAATRVPAALTAGSGTLAVRVSSLPFCTQLAATAGCPLIATSANLSGDGNCLRVEDVPPEIREKAEAMVDGGPALADMASTVVDATGQEIKILREGAVSRQQLEDSCNRLGAAW